MDWELEAVKAKLRAERWEDYCHYVEGKLAKALFENYEQATKYKQAWDEIERLKAENIRLMDCYLYHETILPNGHLGVNVLEVCEGLQKADAEIARLKATIDRTVNAWESRCIEKYDEIKRLNIVIDELILRGDDMLDDLCWLDEYTTPENRASMNAWSEFVNQLEEEREKNV